MFIRESIKAISSLKLADGDRRKIYFGNAIALLRLEMPAAKAVSKKSTKKKVVGKKKIAVKSKAKKPAPPRRTIAKRR